MKNQAQPILTKILATLGPASADPETLTRMVEAGVRVVRINFSHGKLDDFKRMLGVVREVQQRTGEPIAALGDLCGPKIRVLGVQGGKLELQPGDHLEVTQREIDARRDPDTGVVSVGTTYPQMVEDAEPGHRLLINDGNIRTLITDKVKPTDPDTDGRNPSDPRLICRVTAGGTLSPKKGINLPDSDLTAPSLTEWDKTCAAFAVEHDFDFLALSFVRKREDVDELDKLIYKTVGKTKAGRARPRLPIIAKIEMPQAIRELSGIIRAADGVMVARGDLGVEMELAEVPILQKQIIDKAHDHGKPVIVATQMLESMIDKATPTRAEISDVANAILDGADATMLSGETAVGQFPVLTVEHMARTAERAERFIADDLMRDTKPPKLARADRQRPAALAHGVSVMVQDLRARCVVMWTARGGGVRYMSQNRLAVPIVALSPDIRVLRQLALMFGVRPVQHEPPEDSRLILDVSDKVLLERGWAKPGDPIILARGFPMGTPGTTNTVQVHYVGDICRI
ncbi:MAG: pyruvate kinase [Planctomycetota bacterium]